MRRVRCRGRRRRWGHDEGNGGRCRWEQVAGAVPAAAAAAGGGGGCAGASVATGVHGGCGCWCWQGRFCGNNGSAASSSSMSSSETSSTSSFAGCRAAEGSACDQPLPSPPAPRPDEQFGVGLTVGFADSRRPSDRPGVAGGTCWGVFAAGSDQRRGSTPGWARLNGLFIMSVQWPAGGRSGREIGGRGIESRTARPRAAREAGARAREEKQKDFAHRPLLVSRRTTKWLREATM